jgi:hypothetical protein
LLTSTSVSFPPQWPLPTTLLVGSLAISSVALPDAYTHKREYHLDPIWCFLLLWH